jgi:nucleoid-associated protein YgaU
MPEPVVIIGPAAGPAGPVAGPAVSTPERAAEERAEPATSPGPSVFKRLMTWAAVLLGRFLKWFAITLWGLMRQYPRHSLAVGASFAILGGIWYSQLVPGKGNSQSAAEKSKRQPPTNLIGSRSPGSSGQDKNVATASTAPKPASTTGGTGAPDNIDNPAPAPSSIAANGNGGGPSTEAPKPGDQTGASAKTNPETAIAQSEPGSGQQPTLPAPRPSGGGDSVDPSAALAQAPVTEPAPKTAPEKGEPAGEQLAPAPPAQPSATVEKSVAGATLLPGASPSQPTAVAQSNGGKTGDSRSDQSKEKVESVFDSLPPPTTAAALPLTTPLPGDDLGKSATSTDAPPKDSKSTLAPEASPKDAKSAHETEAAHKDSRSAHETEAAQKDPKSNENQSTKPSPSPSDPQPAPPAEANPAGGAQSAERTPSPPATGDSKLDPLPLPEPNSAKPGETNAEVLQSGTTGSDSSTKSSKPTESAVQSDRIGPRPERFQPPAEPRSVPPAEPSGSLVGESSTLAKPSPSRESSVQRSVAGSDSGETRESAAVATGPRPSGDSDRRNATPGSLGTSAPPAGAESPSVTPKAEPRPEPQPTVDKDGARWISIPNTGKVPVDGSEESGASAGSADESGPSGVSLADPRAHAARNVSFETVAAESASGTTKSAVTPAAPAESAPGSRTTAAARPGRNRQRVETVPHIVERDENFWTISRLYYNSGRYYKALWKANEAKYPDINVLHVGDVIMVPDIDDLDQSLFMSGHSSAPAASVARVSRTSGSASGGSHQARPNDPDLDLPAPRSGSRALGSRGPSRSSADDDQDNGEPEIRTAARPRSLGSAPKRPVYKVRPYDTLRSIARDTLGDSRRSSEILDLNRDLIDDPSQLIIGQVLELPEDARSSIRRSASR